MPSIKQPKPRSMIRLEFPKSGKVQPDGFDELTVGQEVTVTLRGTVRELANDPNREWDPGKSCSVEIKGCAFAGVGGGSLADALEKGQRRV